MQEQQAFNRSEFEDEDAETRVQLEGFSPGSYVRVELGHIPYELVEYFSPKYPLILGGLLPSESALGYIQLRFKKHRWYKKILKTRDPVILSVGWRRFETVPLYAIEDHNGRNRLLKYTPEHMHCVALVYGVCVCVCVCVSVCVCVCLCLCICVFVCGSVKCHHLLQL